MDKKEKILDELKGLQGIPSADFEKRLRQILGKNAGGATYPLWRKTGIPIGTLISGAAGILRLKKIFTA